MCGTVWRGPEWKRRQRRNSSLQARSGSGIIGEDPHFAMSNWATTHFGRPHMGDPAASREFNYSAAFTSTANGSFGVGSNFAWDSYQRELYNRLNEALQKQANELRARGAITETEARALVAQRNLILSEARKPLSPFGRLYSEILKPSGQLPTYEKLLAQKGSIEAIVESVGKTRAVVNRLSVVMKYGGRAGIVIQIVVSAVIIREAAPGQRGRTIAGQAGAIGGSALFGWGGAWAGCATAAALMSPSLAIPLVGEGAEGGACLVGGLIGGFGFGALGGAGGQAAGEAIYDYVTQIRWTQP